jgi:hypothetical protein
LISSNSVLPAGESCAPAEQVQKKIRFNSFLMGTDSKCVRKRFLRSSGCYLAETVGFGGPLEKNAIGSWSG